MKNTIALLYLTIILNCLANNKIQAQNQITRINLESNTNFISTQTLNRVNTSGEWFSYAPDQLSEVTFAGIGMAFYWGYMFPSNMLTSYVGMQITKIAYVDPGDTQFAGDYEIHIFLGGDTAPSTEVVNQSFQVTGLSGNIETIILNAPVYIDGTQNIWVCLYQDGSVQNPAAAMTDNLGEPNARWIGVDGYGWMDLSSVGGEGYAWVLWAYAETNGTTYTITATANPTNAGTVSGGGTYAQGSTCTLHATANSGYSFVKWTKNGTQVSTNPNYSFTVTGNAAYVAHFQQNTTNYTITATASPSNAGSITGAGSYASGSTCTLQATPNSGYRFVNWLENGTSVSTNATYSFTVAGNRNLTAVFDVATTNYTITATAYPTNGGTVTGGGTYAQGSTCTLRATANSGYTFVNWTKNGTQISTNPDYSFTVTGNASYVANFEPIPEEYTITVNAEPANGGTVSGGGTYAEGSTCVISAMPNDGYVFDNWTRNGTVVSTEPTYSIVVNRNLTFVAHFAQNANQATITATAEPVEGGSVSGGGTYELGDDCILNAVATAGYEFVNWTLNGNQVSTEAMFSFTVTSNAVYVAHFNKLVNNYTVTVSLEPSSAGSVIGAGTYEEGTTCTLIAISNPTYSFVSWTENGAVVSTEDHFTFTVDRNRSFVAVFSQGLFYTITASAGANGTITPEGEIIVEPGVDKTFAIIPNNGSVVSKVLVDGIDVGPVESYTFRSVSANHSILAQFSGLGVDDNTTLDLKVYPNPANDIINIESQNMKRVSIFNLFGVQIESKDVNDDHAVFSTDNLSQGTYILKVESQEGRIDYTRFILIK